ncbi:sulfatase family protein [Hyunsoonleella pacifica]|uniref:Sulfatase n=1 Tax=Hyunsoonleella pacifica TaxID=1080224 RepID=A0A4Q9FSK6_9FLAO|nr:sulfatase [Hyunsoonleella pacifica]TBN18670.1 sulfatase [Hyunsoonleella pacifica]GGD03691.1 sulfatase [Hyunsoonleella pacifica]
MKTLLYISCLLTILSCKTQDKPNILWITIEDTSPQFIGCYGNENASTPVIDKLAEEGVRFTNAFSTGTVCSASRSTIITGARTYKMGTGHQRSQYPIPDEIKGFPYYLKQLGYYTTNNYKTDYNIANEKDFIKESWDESSGKATWNGRKEGQPFFSVFNFPESHQSRTMSWTFEQYEKHVWNHLPTEDRIADDAFDMPSFYNDTPEMRKQFARVYNSIKLTDNRIGELLQKLEEDGLKDNTIIFFYADHGEGIPRAKTNGINLGYRVPFVVWFPEKYEHLSPWKIGEPTETLISFEDLAPTMIDLLGGEVPEYMNGITMFSKDSKEKNKHLLLSTDRVDNGLDLVRSITNGRYVYSRNYMPFIPEVRYIHYLEIADITKHMRKDLKHNKLNELQSSIFNERPYEVLYDIENDIWETNNLAKNSDYKSVLDEMRQQLDSTVLKSRDILFMPEYSMAEISKKQTPYEFRLDEANYNFEEIYKIASLSGKKGEVYTKTQIEALNNKDKIVRYWASVGLMSQDKVLLKPYITQLEGALNDTYAPVAITASAILYKNFENEKASQILNSYSENKNWSLALMAINYMLYFQDKTPFEVTISELLKAPKINSHVKSACLDFIQSQRLAEKHKF